MPRGARKSQVKSISASEWLINAMSAICAESVNKEAALNLLPHNILYPGQHAQISRHSNAAPEGEVTGISGGCLPLRTFQANSFDAQIFSAFSQGFR